MRGLSRNPGKFGGNQLTTEDVAKAVAEQVVGPLNEKTAATVSVKPTVDHAPELTQ